MRKALGFARRWAFLGAAALGFGAFVELSAELREADGGLAALDQRISLWIAAHRWPALSAAAMDLTALGSTAVVTLLTVVSFILLHLLRDRAGMAQLVVAAAGAGAWSRLLKSAFERERPPLASRLVDVTHYSYPSGHSLASAALYLSFAILARRHFASHGGRAVLFGLSLAVTALIGLTRVYLGVHYPSDVLAGLSLGAAWAFLVAAATEAFVRRRRPDSYRLQDPKH